MIGHDRNGSQTGWVTLGLLSGITVVAYWAAQLCEAHLYDHLGLRVDTLPAELVAYAAAASVAAVERSPATAANEAWNCPSWYSATACWINLNPPRGFAGGVASAYCCG